MVIAFVFSWILGRILVRGDTFTIYVEFYFLNFFNAENHGKRRLNPFQITTPERQRQNADLPQSKASFAVLQRDKTMYKNFGHSSCFLNSQLKCSGDEACFNPVAISRKKNWFFLSQ